METLQIYSVADYAQHTHKGIVYSAYITILLHLPLCLPPLTHKSPCCRPSKLLQLRLHQRPPPRSPPQLTCSAKRWFTASSSLACCAASGKPFHSLPHRQTWAIIVLASSSTVAWDMLVSACEHKTAATCSGRPQKASSCTQPRSHCMLCSNCTSTARSNMKGIYLELEHVHLDEAGQNHLGRRHKVGHAVTLLLTSKVCARLTGRLHADDHRHAIVNGLLRQHRARLDLGRQQHLAVETLVRDPEQALLVVATASLWQAFQDHQLQLNFLQAEVGALVAECARQVGAGGLEAHAEELQRAQATALELVDHSAHRLVAVVAKPDHVAHVVGL
eukprot:355359-Chlamydomonas_euryale.AAC.17